MEDILTQENFLLYAAKHYTNPCHDDEEFYDDLKRINYIKRLLGKYHETNELRERLIINHLIILYNIFGNHATKMLFLRVKKEHYPYLKPFLVLLNRMPNRIENIHKPGYKIISSDIPMDPYIINKLREI